MKSVSDPKARAMLGCSALMAGLVGAVMVAGIIGVVIALMTGTGLADLSEGEIGALPLAALTLIQFALFTGVAILCAWTISTKPLLRAMGATKVAGGAVALGFVAGATVGRLPTFVVEYLVVHGIADADALAMMGNTLQNASGPAFVLLLFSLCIAAPVVEELVFRGVLWDFLAEGLPPWAVWLATSAIFAAYHADPLWIAAVFPIGLLMGWLRMVTGSVWPAMAAHFANNSLAIGLAEVGYGESSLVQAAIGLVLTIGAAAAAWHLYYRRQTEGDDEATAPASP